MSEYGSEVVDPSDKKAPYLDIGRTGLIQYGGRVYEEFLPQLQGYLARKVYREMSDNDPIVGAMLFAIDMLMRQVEWRVDGDAQAAQFIESCMHDMSQGWTDFVSSAMSMCPFGYSYHEKVYKKRNGRTDLKRGYPGQPKNTGGAAGWAFVDDSGAASSKYDDGKIGWRKLPVRAQETQLRWEMDRAGGIHGFWQLAPPDYHVTFIPIEKALLFRTTSHKGNPEGRSILRNAYRPWYFKKRIEEIEAIGVERDLAGLPIFWIPPEYLSDDATPEQQMMAERAAKLVRNIRKDEQQGIVMPNAFDMAGHKLFDLTLLQGTKGRPIDTDKIITRYNTNIAMVTIADVLLMGHEKVGTQALSLTKADLFTGALQAWLKGIADVFNTHELPYLLWLNGIKGEAELIPGAVGQVDLVELSTFLMNLSTAGAPLFPDDKLEDYVREIAGLPEKTPGPIQGPVSARPTSAPPNQGAPDVQTPPQRVLPRKPGDHNVLPGSPGQEDITASLRKRAAERALARKYAGISDSKTVLLSDLLQKRAEELKREGR